jgi:REP element-mobilizing transposase RayT
MGYPPRVERTGCYYHVGTRGNNQRSIYRDPSSRSLFLVRLGIVVRRYEWTLVTYCLMTNHYHLVLKVGDSGMARGMQQLNGGYAIAFNARAGRRDHLFGRRYWSRELEDDDDLLETCRYVDLNPVRKGLTRVPQDWRWSGYAAAIGLAAPERFHRPDELWRYFDRRPRVAMDIYRRFVEEALPGTRPVSDTGFPPAQNTPGSAT